MRNGIGMRISAALALVVAAETIATAAEKGSLQIWINGDKAYNGLAEIGKRFTKETGIPVTVEHPQDAPSKFQQAAAAGKGPDIMIWARDRAGEWVAAGLVEPVNPKCQVQGPVREDRLGRLHLRRAHLGLPAVHRVHRAHLQQGHRRHAAEALRGDLDPRQEAREER